MNIQREFFFILLTSGNALLFLKRCVFLISSPPPPVLFRNFQKWLEMVLFSARLGNGICSGTNHWHSSLAGNKKWHISKLARENILESPSQFWPPGTDTRRGAVGLSHEASVLQDFVLTAAPSPWTLVWSCNRRAGLGQTQGNPVWLSLPAKALAKQRAPHFLLLLPGNCRAFLS